MSGAECIVENVDRSPARQSTDARLGMDTDAKSLYDALTRGDEQPAILCAAEECLRRSLSAAEPAAEVIVSEWGFQNHPPRTAIPGSSYPADESLVGYSAVVPWLVDEPLVLRRITQADTAESPIHAMLFGVYERWRAAKLFGAGATPFSIEYWNKERRWSRLPALPARVNVAWIKAAGVRTALSCFPSRRLPEILGYLWATLESLVDVLPPDGRAGSFAGERVGSFDPCSDVIDALQREQSVCKRALDYLFQDQDSQSARSLRRRVAHGTALQRTLLAHIEAAYARDGEPADSVLALAEVLRRKAEYAVGYHGGVFLAGRNLDAWFAQEPFDAPAFLEALAGSDWVDPCCPHRSRLLRLLDFDGPMFGIFTAEEQATVRAWLASLADRCSSRIDANQRPPRTGADARKPPSSTDAREVCSNASRESVSPHPGSGLDPPLARPACPESVPVGNRRLYHLLLNIEQHPERLPDAQYHAERCLARIFGRCFGGRPPFQYSDVAFDAWLRAQYRKQLRAPRSRSDRPLLSRDAYRFGIEQLAPAILVDGCWLQRADQLRDRSPEAAQRLMAIYADEMGNGVLEHNHPYVYRRLLESLAIDLPATASAEFARYPGFLHSSFDLPVFLLAIGLFPQRFLPELLGLNLAIELSGLGVSYSRVARELEYWGIDARIVRLHQSIDNLASGHAALAKECVMIHLEQVGALGGEPSVLHHWRRVWTGYRSLAAVTRRFRWQLVLRYAAMAGTVRMGRLFERVTSRAAAL